MIVISILQIAFILEESSTFITRLSACKYSANYTIRTQDKYFKGKISITIPMVSRENVPYIVR